jgi:hypothetical protein
VDRRGDDAASAGESKLVSNLLLTAFCHFVISHEIALVMRRQWAWWWIFSGPRVFSSWRQWAPRLAILTKFSTWLNWISIIKRYGHIPGKLLWQLGNRLIDFCFLFLL